MIDDLRASLSTRDLLILRAVKQYRILSTRQIQRLHFADPGAHASIQGATRATHRALLRLRVAKLITPLQRRIGGSERGSSGSLWQLDETGAQLLRSETETPKRQRVREPTTGMFVRHTVAVADAAITIMEAATHAHLDVLHLDAEPAAWRTFLGRHGQPESLRPDLYVVLANPEYEEHTFLEIDEATEHQPQILRKSHIYARYSTLGAAERDAGVTPRVLWVTPSARRRDALRRTISSDPTLPHSMFVVITSDELPAAIVQPLTTETAAPAEPEMQPSPSP